MSNDWKPTYNAPEGVLVHTMFEDKHGKQVERVLKRIGTHWYVPDGSVYVYDRPTHYKDLGPIKLIEGGNGA